MKTRSKWIAAGAVIAAVIVVSVAYYEVGLKPGTHVGFVSRQEASSILGANFTQSFTGSASGINSRIFANATSVTGVLYDNPYSSVKGELVIGVAEFPDSASSHDWYTNQTSSANNSVYNGFTFDVVTITGLPLFPVIANGIDGKFAFTLSDPSPVANSSSVTQLVDAQINAML